MLEKGKVLAIDYGRRAVGIASGDLDIAMAFPRDVIENKGVNDLLEKVLSLVSELSVVLVVIGVPDENNYIYADIVAFGRLLESRGVLVELVDENFSSIEAKQMFNGSHSGRLDANAAQVILQRFFDMKRG